jgi:hypothetical protein
MRALAVLSLLSLAAPAAARELDSAGLDKLVAAEWKKARLKPAPPVDDARFLRRLYLDLAGVIPPPQVVTAFLDDRQPDKRTRAVNALLDGPQYADHFTAYWDKVLMGRQVFSQIVDRARFRAWLHDELENNTRWDALARALVTATGENKVDGATNWILKFAQAPQDLAGKASRLFLGVQIQCAQCHNHPTESWKQEDFRKLAACFANTGPKPLEQGKVQGVRRAELKDFPIPVIGLGPKMQTDAELRAIAGTRPAALDGTDFTASANRRQALADWMVSPKNPWFARAMVNRMWAYLLGRGFVEPIDDFRRSNPIVAPAILDALAADFVEHGYDLKRLIRLICGTRAYQLAAQPAKNADNGDAERLWARYRLRAPSPEELLDSVMFATNVEPLFQKVAGANFEKQKTQLRNIVTFLFDVDEETEQTEYEGTVPQTLLLLNGPLVNSGASALPGTTLTDVLAMPLGDEAKIETLYLRTLSRKPTAAELSRWAAFVRAPRDVVSTGPKPPPPKPDSDKPKLAKKLGADPIAKVERRVAAGLTAQGQAYEDLFWALLNSSEFYFRH